MISRTFMTWGFVAALCVWASLASKAIGQSTGGLLTSARDSSGQRKKSEIELLRERVERLEKMNSLWMESVAPRKSDIQNLTTNTATTNTSATSTTSDGEKVKTEKPAAVSGEAWYEVGTRGAMKVDWKNGLFFETPNKDFLFRLGGRLNWDTGWFNQSAGMPNLQDASDFRRLRIEFQGTVWETMFWRMATDFADSTSGLPLTNFRDAYFGFTSLPFLDNVIVGQFKEQMSLSWMSTANQLVFLERAAMNDALIPPRSVGIGTYQSYADESIWFATALMRSMTNDGGFSQGDGQYAWDSRLVILPYWAQEGRYLIHLGCSYSRRAHGATGSVQFSTRDDVRLGTPNLLNTGTLVGVSNQNIFNGEFLTILGPLSIQSEATYTTFDTPSGASPGYWGAYVMASYFLTGEHRRYSKTGPYGYSVTTMQPNENFFCVRGQKGVAHGLGAWEVAARLDYLNLQDANIVNPTTSSGVGGTGTLKNITVGLNWYFNSNMKVMFNYIHGWRQSDTAGFNGELNALAMRYQFFF